MRRQFADWMLEAMKSDPRLWVVVGDLGYGMWDRVRDKFPERFANVGSAEQLLVDCCVGLTLAGKVPVAYSITPFLLYRPFESLRTYVNHERIGVKLVGSGRGRDYAHDGISHWADDDAAVLNSLPNIVGYWPDSVEGLLATLPLFMRPGQPAYLNLRR